MSVNEPASSPSRARLSRGPGAATAAGLYLLLTLVMTWPVAGDLWRKLPADLGDPLLNCWILGWDAHHLLRFLGGHLTGLAGYWSANIFYPAPLALAYSEHLTGQAIEILPVFALTGNLVLCYDLLFLSTFVLSGLGVYLLVRELTGSRWAAFAAGLIYAFLPYRFGQFPHLQILSSQWMPLALYGFLRYFETRRRRALAGGAAALVAQNLSCGYFMVFFAVPFVAFILVEIGRRRLWRDRRLWGDLTVAGIAVAAATLPFAWPYLELRALGFAPRGLYEVNVFAADVYSYVTTSHRLRLLGPRLQVFPKPEGQLFLGFTAYLLGAIGVAWAARDAWRSAAGLRTRRRALRWLAWPAAIVLVVYTGLWMAMLVRGSFIVAHSPIGPLRVMSGFKVLRAIAAALAVLLVASARARGAARRFALSPPGLFALLALFAVWMSLGPYVHSAGRALHNAGIYTFFYDVVPGFDGLRVPARFGMIAGLFLSVLAGYGAAALGRRRRVGLPLVLVACALVLVESWAAPIAVNQRWADFNHQEVVLPHGLPARADFPPVYRFLRTLPAGAPVVEFPFGEYPIELRYMYFSTAHWHPLLNGYSGGFPPLYLANRTTLRRVLTNPDQAWAALARSGAAYAVVHEALYRGGRGTVVAAWLAGHGARQIAVFGPDRVFKLQGPTAADGTPPAAAPGPAAGTRPAP